VTGSGQGYGPGDHQEEDAFTMQQQTRELLAALEDADWFSCVGQPVPELLQSDVIVVPSWAGAVQCCSSISWENYTLVQQNLLTSYLHEHARDRYQRWNEIVDEMKAAFEPLLERKLRPVVEEHALPEVVGHCVRWDLLGACMEGEYADVRPPSFFTCLMGWYMRGRFPCGWGEVDLDGGIRIAETEPENDPAGPDPMTRALSFPLLEPRIESPEGRLIVF
jgi:hypothetical protein